jgi:hypothetical protein
MIIDVTVMVFEGRYMNCVRYGSEERAAGVNKGNDAFMMMILNEVSWGSGYASS